MKKSDTLVGGFDIQRVGVFLEVVWIFGSGKTRL